MVLGLLSLLSLLSLRSSQRSPSAAIDRSSSPPVEYSWLPIVANWPLRAIKHEITSG